MYKLYDFQERVKRKTALELSKNDKVLVCLPTGGGKTIIANSIIKTLTEKNKTVLFTTPRIKLVTQSADKIGVVNIIQGNNTEDNNSLCTVATLQTLYSRKITQHFDFIIIDEAHYGNATDYMNYIFETYKKSKIIGLSATPLDNKGYLLTGYDALVNEVTLKELIKLGNLTDVECYVSLLKTDFKKVAINNGDYNMGQANDIVSQPKVLTNYFTEWAKYAIEKKTLVFACNIDHAEKLKDEFLNNNIKTNCVHSNLSEKEIEQSYLAFKNNEIQVLINVDMATFGFDEPSIECLLFARPIKSLRLYKQMVGRGIRSFKGKEKCTIIDCANVIEDNGYPTEELVLNKQPLISKIIDNKLQLEREINGSTPSEITMERIEYLTKISSLIDLYSNKKYLKESDLQDDVKKILKKVSHFFWRQNSGKLFKDGRWIHFTDKNGLPDITLLFHSVYVGLELKLPHGKLTKHQKETLPQMLNKKVLFFIVENIIDLFDILEHLIENIVIENENIIIKKQIFIFPEQQLKYFNKYNIVNK